VQSALASGLLCVSVQIVAKLDGLTRKEMLEVAERLSEQNEILQRFGKNQISRTHEYKVSLMAMRLLMLTLSGNQRPGAHGKELRALAEDAFARTGSEDVVFPEFGFGKLVAGVELDHRGEVRRSEPDDPWTPPFDQLTEEQAAAYIDAEVSDNLDAVHRVAFWTMTLDDFNQAMPIQLLEQRRYRELWEWAARMRHEDRWRDRDDSA
jgi:hypothetical protein